MEPEQPENRRRFLLSLIYGLWGFMGVALAAPAIVYLFLPPRLRKEPEWIVAGKLSDLPLNTPSELVFRQNRLDGWKLSSEKSTAWIVRTSDKDVVAFAPQCTHLGCAYHWDDAKHQFLCPCHSSVFSIDGKVVSGPAPRPLDRYDTRIEDNQLLLGAIHELTEPAE